MSQSTESSAPSFAIAPPSDLTVEPTTVDATSHDDASASMRSLSEMTVSTNPPLHPDSNEQAPITARSGSRLSQLAPLADAAEERGFFADGEVGRYAGGPEEFADPGSFAETMSVRPASTRERWASLAVVLAVSGVVAGGTVVATGWLDNWLGKGRRVEAAAARADSTSARPAAELPAAHGEAEALVAEPELGTPAAGVATAGVTAASAAADAPPAETAAAEKAAAIERTDSATSASGTPSPAAVAATVTSGSAGSDTAAADSAAVSTPGGANRGLARNDQPPAGKSARSTPQKVRSSELAAPRPANPNMRKSFAPSAAKPPASPAAPAPAAPAKKPAVVSFPSN